MWRGTMDRPPIDVEEVPMQRHQPRRSAQVAASLALAAVLFVGACSSSPADHPPTTKVDPLPRENTSYLLSIGWEKGQAVCVSRLVKVDLEALLSAPDGSAAPTKKPGYEAFADAVRTCLRKDTGLSSTTVPAG